MNPTLELTSQRQGKDNKTSELKAGSSDNYYSEISGISNCLTTFKTYKLKLIKILKELLNKYFKLNNPNNS